MSKDGGFVGCICISRNGHDKGAVYVLQSVFDDKFVLLVNGENRPTGKPKRKNVAHVSITNHRTAATSDLAIKMAIKNFKKRGDE
jgi:ribosomal protein L14E/L6E/L27E